MKIILAAAELVLRQPKWAQNTKPPSGALITYSAPQTQVEVGNPYFSMRALLSTPDETRQTSVRIPWRTLANPKANLLDLESLHNPEALCRLWEHVARSSPPEVPAPFGRVRARDMALMGSIIASFPSLVREPLVCMQGADTDDYVLFGCVSDEVSIDFALRS